MAKVRDSGMPPADVWESFYDPDAAFAALGCVQVSGDAIEFGCGYGIFTTAVSHRTNGNVYALDLDPLMVRATSERAAQAGASNVIVEQRDFVTQGSGRPARSAALAILFNIMHIEDPIDLLREARRILRDGGSAAVIHWRHDIETPRGPPPAIRPRPEQCAAWAEAAGFRAGSACLLPGSPWHWGMMLGAADSTPCESATLG